MSPPQPTWPIQCFACGAEVAEHPRQEREWFGGRYPVGPQSSYWSQPAAGHGLTIAFTLTFCSWECQSAWLHQAASMAEHPLEPMLFAADCLAASLWNRWGGRRHVVFECAQCGFQWLTPAEIQRLPTFDITRPHTPRLGDYPASVTACRDERACYRRRRDRVAGRRPPAAGREG